ncbi:hypothetical protein Swoo_2328 [Shewanella woodyi ATCC 51908]|uniref:Uncharacterized protein n=1 Tax=Shewanella woodyi (strain ATCC 51908 / MS32) TaxID=392500 RepID=B1KF66_SHEWM|nr:hypothetical protein Swoo_2328 [Shewanella woodyi ATCC 51908]
MVSDNRYVYLLMLIVVQRQKLSTTEGEHNGSYKLANERYEVELALRKGYRYRDHGEKPKEWIPEQVRDDGSGKCSILHVFALSFTVSEAFP